MLENENLAAEEKAAENAENPAEETPIYTEAQFRQKVKETVDASIGKKIARNEAKIRKEYDKTYGGLVDVLKAGTGEQDVAKLTDSLKSFYESKGVDIPQRAEYSQKDIEALGKMDADDIIRSGFDEVIEEADRLKGLGVENMTAREKAAFLALSKHIKSTEETRALAEIGADKEIYGSEEFKNFASKFISDIPIKDIYDIYLKNTPKKEIKPMGSMKNNTPDNSVKEYYSYEEAMKFTKEDFDKNPELYKAVQKSMTKW